MIQLGLQKLSKIADFRSAFFFLCVGGLTSVFYFCLFTFFWHYCHLHYRVAITLAFFMAATGQFFLNRNLTFKNHNRKIGGQFIRFFTMVGINYLITLAVVSFLVEVLSLWPSFSVVVSIGVTVVTGYLMSKFWVFHHDANKIIKEQNSCIIS